MRLRRRRVNLQGLGQYLERATEILQLPLHLAEQRQELGVAGGLGERGVELLACAFESTEIEIDVGQVEAGGNERGIEGQRLPQLCDGLTHEVRRPGCPVGDTEEHVPLCRAWIDGQDVLEGPDGFVGATSAGEELGPDAGEFLLR